MIYDEQTCKLLENEVPEIRRGFLSWGSKTCIAGLKLLTAHSAALFEKGSTDGARRCSQTEQLIAIGSARVATILTVEFMTHIYPRSRTETVTSCRIRNLMTGQLPGQYRYQVSMDQW